MDRRHFLKPSASMAAAVSLAQPLAAQQSASPEGRAVLPINRGWRYTPHADAGFHKPAFQDATWERV